MSKKLNVLNVLKFFRSTSVNKAIAFDGDDFLGRKHSQAVTSIHRMCRLHKLDEPLMNTKARLLLNIYRDVCWYTIGRADVVHEELAYYCSGELNTALLYLETFSADEQRDRFEDTVRSLFETKWMVELVDTAMLKVREFPYNGELYFEILSKCYLNRFNYTESELLEILKLERSSYYDRKKEAILVFGLAMWGGAIPQLKAFLNDTQEELQKLPWSVFRDTYDDEDTHAELY